MPHREFSPPSCSSCSRIFSISCARSFFVGLTLDIGLFFFGPESLQEFLFYFGILVFSACLLILCHLSCRFPSSSVFTTLKIYLLLSTVSFGSSSNINKSENSLLVDRWSLWWASYSFPGNKPQYRHVMPQKNTNSWLLGLGHRICNLPSFWKFSWKKIVARPFGMSWSQTVREWSRAMSTWRPERCEQYQGDGQAEMTGRIATSQANSHGTLGRTLNTQQS